MIPSLKKFRQGIDVASADNMNTWVQGGALAAQLRNLTGLPGMTVMCSGINVVDDGFGGFFYWNAASTEPDDNMDYIVPDGTYMGAWWRLTLVTQGPGAPTILNNDLTILGFLAVSTQTGITAGITPYQLIANLNIVANVAPATGVILPALNRGGFPLSAGTAVKVYNRGANTLEVFPPVGMRLESLATNAPLSIIPGGVAIYDYSGGVQWYVS